MMALRQPCPGCPLLSWIQEHAATCDDCGCTLERYELATALGFELDSAARALPRRCRDLTLIALAEKLDDSSVRPALSRQELAAIDRFRDALRALWAFDDG